MFEIKMKSNTKAEVLLYDDIGDGGWGIGPVEVSKELKAAGKGVKEIDVRINSYGGDVFAGVAIYNIFKQHQASVSVFIDGVAASIASIIALSADPGKLKIAENGFYMVHNPWGFAMGTANDMRERADLLDKIRGTLLDTYMTRTSVERGVISEYMDGETWFTAQEALEVGLVDATTEAVEIAACVNKELYSKFKRIPENLISNNVTPINTPRLKNSRLLSTKMQRSLKRFKI